MFKDEAALKVALERIPKALELGEGETLEAMLIGAAA
jgi:hypothetical protein|tara:strand:- start:16739 stop:16849 length:111 start_codon:yes stop_codon:yes gene_type:complete